jgi:leucyl aminopeptidase
MNQLLQNGKESEKPLKYSHLDIAASAGDLPDPATGAPILALSKRFLNKEFEDNLAKNSS